MQRRTQGWLNGLVGVVIFSGSLPATRLAVMEFDAVFLTGARAVLAALLAAGLLLAGRQRQPARQDLIPLLLVALGCVVAFPLLTGLALQRITSAHAMVFIGALPLATAIFAVLRGGERPRPAFWLFSLLGSGMIAGYALAQGVAVAPVGDVLMLVAIVACGLGYAEGARLTARLGGWQVISWALVLSLPVMLPLAWFTAPASFDGIHAPAWLGLGYVSVFSMLVGFVFWYRGLAQGGVASVAQLQLLQPFLGLTLAAVLLQEQVTWLMQLAAVMVIGCVAGARKFAR
jgi:drug/metabolite transporter (DMT)-like permease